MRAAPAREEFVPADALTGASTFQCALCGLRFSHGGKVCGSCPLASGCDLVRCPACGYQFPRGSRTLAWLGRSWQALTRRRPARSPRDDAGGDVRSAAAAAQGGSGGSARAIGAEVEPAARAIPPR